MSYSIVHDMRAPLRAMHGFTGILQEECDGCPCTQSLEYFGRIETASSRMDRLITDALHYTKAVLQELPAEPVDLSQLVDDLLRTYPNLQPDQSDIRLEGTLPVVRGMRLS